MTTLRGVTLHGTLAFRYDSAPPWFLTLFAQIAQVYAASAAKPARVELTGVCDPLAQLLRRYYAVNAIAGDFAIAGAPAPVEPAARALGDERITVLLSGGKDSVHNLIRAVELYGRSCVQAVYVDKINRSECSYERPAAAAIAGRLGVRYRCVEGLNSIKLNRTAHNIGLREQLLVTLALPHIVAFGSRRFSLGVTLSPVGLPGSLWTDSEEAWALYLSALRERYGLDLSFGPHVDFPEIDELRIIRDLVVEHPAIMELVRSCYTQRNWREQMHRRLAERVPDVPIYNGCGSCIKCLRINGAMLLYDPRLARAPADQVATLREHVLRIYADKGLSADRYLAAIVAQLTAGVAA